MSKDVALLTGATGFVGRHAAVALAAAGFRVRGLTRSVERARAAAPEIEWVEGDLESPSSIDRAISGASTAVYLYHAVGAGPNYVDREASVARDFARAADRARVGRIVYLGGVVPDGARSRHLESRRITGETLRAARTTTIELRASMVIGHGSASFGLIRDVAVRLPFVALPRWLDHESYPISIDDAAAAIALAAREDSSTSRAFELPGPERISHRRLIGLLTSSLGTKLIEPPLVALTPRLAGWALAAISGVEASLSRELVLGLDADLTPSGESFWARVGSPGLRPLRHAIVDALCDEAVAMSPGPETRRRIAKKTIEWSEGALGAARHA